ncbi:beta-ketoacyl synthase N-terminal-like domain-containing protein [Streptomyces huasconensis]|uniref:beta-ketoacyl synthase N-terminal-like domain-containing protein n=1 Tax=Streptomyces huasconensis TaxID=1854574 RepID=UPI0033D89272
MDIAITGMSVRVPASDTPWELHRLLLRAESAIDHFDAKHSDLVGARGLIDRHDWFDTQRFNIAEAEATRMDPQHRLVLEEAVRAMESAGHAVGEHPLECGVFASCSASINHWTTRQEEAADNPIARYNVLLGNDKDFLATRLSWHLDLTGPAMSVQSGCSSSLVALHQACQALRNGDCSIALVAAASLTLPLQEGSPVTEGMIFSPSGQCNPYTDKADGTVGGTGAVVLVLEPLDQVLREGGPCWGVIKGSAVNNDGRKKVSFTAPSIDQQSAVMNRALAKADVDPARVGYIEGHGTGTVLGDSLELAALMEVYGQRQGPMPSLGSIKANIGHLDAASGLVGVVKCVLALHHRVIYPQPGMDGARVQTSFQVHAQPSPWQRPDELAAVTSLGVGGTNVHMLLAPPPSRPAAALAGPFWFPLAAASEDGLRLLARHLLEVTEDGGRDALPHHAWTLQHRYRQDKQLCQCHLQVESWDQLRRQLEQLCAGVPLDEVHCPAPPTPLDASPALYRVPLPATPLNSRPLHGTDIKTTVAPTPPVRAENGSLAEVIAAEWQRSLGVSTVPHADSHFFEEGGDSLLSVQLVQALTQRGVSSCSVADLYEAPRLGDFVRRVLRDVREVESVDDDADDGIVEL